MYYIYTSWYYDTIIRTETGDRQGGYKDSKQTRTYICVYLYLEGKRNNVNVI